MDPWRFKPPAPVPLHRVERLCHAASGAGDHMHVTGVTTVTDGGERTWELREFVEAVRHGERFVLHEGGSWRELEPADCDLCRLPTISTLSRPRKG